MMLLRMLPAATAVLSIAVTMMLFGPLVLYVLARWRANRAGVSDPQLGLKFALHWFATSAFHLALGGAAFLIFTLIGPGPSSAKGEMYRAAFAMLVPAGIILGVHLMLLKRTNDEEVTGVRRLFLGYNLFITGLVGFISVVMGFQLLFAKGSTGGAGHMVAALVLVYGGAWGVLGHRFGQLVLGGPGSHDGGMPEVVMPPGPPPAVQPPAAAGGAGLPALGGGSYPPIEPK